MKPKVCMKCNLWHIMVRRLPYSFQISLNPGSVIVSSFNYRRLWPERKLLIQEKKFLIPQCDDFLRRKNFPKERISPSAIQCF
jgi:hypothetical protein